jgi:hypothetical protein
MRPGATLPDYQRALKIMFPQDDPGLGHHKFWDAQDFTQTPHLGIAESVQLIAEGRSFTPGPVARTATGMFDSPMNIAPGLAQDLGRQVGRETIDDVPLTPPFGLAQQARSQYQQAHLNDPQRVATDIAANRELARKAYMAHTRTAEGFDALWERAMDWVEQTLTISMGVGSADSARAIINSGQPIANGMARWGVQVGRDFPEKLIAAQAKALGLDKGERKNEAIVWGAAKGINNPKEAIRDYARHFLTIEAGSFGKVGLGDPTRDADAVNGMYASVHEGLPNLQQMGGGIHFLVNPKTTEYTTSVHHPFSFESPVVLPMHKGTAIPLKDTFTPQRQGELAEAAGRAAMQRFGPKGEYEISGSPMLVGPAATAAARAAALFMTAQKSGPGGDVLKIAARGTPEDVERAAALLVRGTPGQARGYSLAAIGKAAAETPARDLGAPGVGYNLAQSSSFARTEALVHNLTPENVSGVVVRGNNAATVAENAQAARDLMAHYGIDAPIYIAWGPEGDPNPGVYKLTDQGPVATTLNEGRAKLIETVKGLGEENFGLTPQAAVQRQGQNPAQWLNTPVLSGVPGGTRLGMMGSTGLAGAAIGGTQGETPEERRQNAIRGFGAGATLSAGLTSARGYNLLKNSPVVGKAAKGLLTEALAAQRAAMQRKGTGFRAVQSLTSVWKVQATSTLRNLLQDEATARLWLADAGVRTKMMNDNWASLVDLYNQGVRDPYLALPQDTTSFLDAVGRTGYVPEVGASFMEANGKMVQSGKLLTEELSAGDTGKLEAGLSLLNPLQGGIPILGAGLGFAENYTRAFQQKLFDQINSFTRIASRHAAFMDTVEKELPGVADAFIKAHGLQPLAGRGGLFTAADVDALVPGLGPAWDKNVDTVIARAEARAKDILGDYNKKLKGEGLISSVFPFTSYALRAYPRTGKMMLHHPGISLAIMLLMAKGANYAEQQGLPGYLGGTVPIDTDTPVAGGVVRAMAGGQDATGYANPLALLSPVGGAFIAGEEMPEDANLYQKADAAAGRLGFSFNPLIMAGAVATNKDYRLPSAPSRTAAIEQALPGPELPSLTQGPINFLREQAGGSALETTSLDRRIAQVFYEATGKALNDPAVQRDPRLAALAASTLDPASPLVQEARSRELQSGLARTTVGMVSPVSVSARTDIQRVQDVARQQARALPPAAYDPAEIRQARQSRSLADQVEAMRMAAANRGTQVTPPPEAGITSGVSRKARAYATLEAWQRQNRNLKYWAPNVYAEQEQQLREQLGIQ